MIPVAVALGAVAIVGVCVVSRWCTEMQNQLDALEQYRAAAPTLAERLQADQRRHVERYADQETTGA